LRVIEGYGALPAFGLLNQLQVGDTGPAESTRQGNLQRVGLLFLGSRDTVWVKNAQIIRVYQLHLNLSGQHQPVLLLDVSSPQGPELHLDEQIST
jgi:hypothetical protein